MLRLFKIIGTSLRYGLDEFFIGHERLPALRWIFGRRRFDAPRAVRLRLALEGLGPIFIKFGQILSTRRDLLPPDIADELAKLQDQVPPFASALAIETLEREYERPLNEVFAEFEPVPVASASVAQVHFARLHDGTEVAVKVLRPGIAPVIADDIALLHTAATLMEWLWADGRRLRPHEVVDEFARHLEDELDLLREAANASQLGRNFENSPLLLVPAVYWDYCTCGVMVMQRMHGTPISHTASLRAQGIDLEQLSRTGVEVFFTQVFRDGFFHADMHPGNIYVAADGRYIALDFGIMGTLHEDDKQYLARNFLAFFQRDYRGVARAHIESGWVPPGTSIDAFENAIRSVCEPIFARPLSEISFGKVLMRLFQVSRRFNMEVQPQLVLLQKTLLNIEGLGRDLDPHLDLWTTFKPQLERWMSEQLGWRAFLRNLGNEAPRWSALLPELPRLVHRALTERDDALRLETAALLLASRERNRLLRQVCIVLSVIAGLIAAALLR